MKKVLLEEGKSATEEEVKKARDLIYKLATLAVEDFIITQQKSGKKGVTTV